MMCSSRMSHNRSRATIIEDNSVINETTTYNRRSAAFRFYMFTDDDESITAVIRRKRIVESDSLESEPEMSSN